MSDPKTPPDKTVFLDSTEVVAIVGRLASAIRRQGDTIVLGGTTPDAVADANRKRWKLLVEQAVAHETAALMTFIGLGVDIDQIFEFRKVAMVLADEITSNAKLAPEVPSPDAPLWCPRCRVRPMMVPTIQPPKCGACLTALVPLPKRAAGGA